VNVPDLEGPSLSSFYRRVELLANLAIVLLAIVIGIVLVHRFLRPENPSSKRAAIAAGTSVSLPGIDWKQNHRTLLVAIQEGCHFCTDSAPFYQRLADVADKKGVKLVAVLPQSTDEGRRYLTTLGVRIADVRQAPLSSLQVNGTPTLILVDENGRVAASWVGKLPSDKETEVLARL